MNREQKFPKRRKAGPSPRAQRFELGMSQIFGKRLTYAELTGKGVDSLHYETTGTWLPSI